MLSVILNILEALVGKNLLSKINWILGIELYSIYTCILINPYFGYLPVHCNIV